MILADRAFFIWLFRVSCEGVFTTEAQSSQSSEYFLIYSGQFPAACCVMAIPSLLKVCHSRMLLAGIQAKFGLDPR
jgi:hypothetical protein